MRGSVLTRLELGEECQVVRLIVASRLSRTCLIGRDVSTAFTCLNRSLLALKQVVREATLTLSPRENSRKAMVQVHFFVHFYVYALFLFLFNFFLHFKFMKSEKRNFFSLTILFDQQIHNINI
jgi:hypothetical protein